MTSVEQIWQEIGAKSERAGLFRRVDETHPLDLYAGLDLQSKPVLMLVTTEEPPALPPPGIVQVTCNRRASGDFATVLQLVRTEYDELFGRLCQDLVDATRTAPRHGGAEALLRRLGRWRRLLEVGQRATLSDAALRGLVGELWFLDAIAIPRRGVDAAVNGWVGPLDAPQDFSLGGDVIEIKTCMPGTQQVTISSLQQLDAGAAPLYLVVLWLAPADSTTDQAFTPAQLVASLRGAVEMSASAATEFSFRLAESGYTDSDEYDRVWYRVTHVAHFRIQEGFPRLTRIEVPPGLLEATYTINLALCGPYECPSYGEQ